MTGVHLGCAVRSYTSPHIQQVQAHGVLQYKVGGKRVKHKEGGTRVQIEARQCPHCQAGGGSHIPDWRSPERIPEVLTLIFVQCKYRTILEKQAKIE